jgi:hypothetical protein
MAVSTAAPRVRAAAPSAPPPAPARSGAPRPATAPPRRQADGSLRRAAATCATLVVGSLLAVVAANAYLTQGQVRLTRLQQQLSTELGQHSDLEHRVAVLTAPASVVAEAQDHGLVAPDKVTDIPQLPVSPSPAASEAAGQDPSRSNGGR